MQLPDNTIGLASAYLRIVFLGTLGNIGYNLNAGILRGVGDSRATLLFLMVSCAVNILLDLLFVAVFGLDVSGTALATAIALFASWFFSIGYIRRRYPELGLTINSFSSSCATFSGQNYGAKQYGRLVRGARIPFISGLFTLTGGILVTVFCYPLLRLFTRDEEVLALAVQYIHVVLPMTWPFAVFSGLVNYANGMGDVKLPTMISIFMLWVIRIPSAWLISHFIDGHWMMACYPMPCRSGIT